MSSFLIYELGENFSKENITFILDITNEEILNDISKFILSKKDKDAVSFLIQNDKIPKSMGLDLFQFIVNNKFWDMFLDLDYNKFDIHADDDYALRMNSEYGHIDVVKFLIENGANIRANYNYALIMSSRNGYIDVVKFLIENGANIHAYNDRALKMSSKYGHIEVVKFLIENGANIHADNDDALKDSSYHGHIKIVKFLIEKGANIHTGNDFALIWSSHNGHIGIVKFLIENGANIHADDDSALRFSSQNGHIEVVKFLIEKGADIHADNDYGIRCSSYRGYIDVVKFLVENGADIHAYGDHALRWSSEYGQFEVIKYLLNSDLEYFSKNKKAIKIVKNHKLYEFYEKFGIYNDLPQSKNDILKYIDSQDLDSLKKCDEFDFSMDNYFCFFKALLLNNDEIIKVIFDFTENKEGLKSTFDNISPYFDDNTKNRFIKLYKNTDFDKIKNKLENLLNEIKILQSQ